MSLAPTTVYFAPYGDGSIVGRFDLVETGNLFEYSTNPDPVMAPLAHGGKSYYVEFPHMVWVTTPSPLDSGFRMAKVSKTVVHMIVDEDENGWVVDKWKIRNHVMYDNS
tara:strand:+ start:1580 stop:1906 length:327 start_codon:yes stop_codon:yes gene_type:complete